MYGKNCYLTRYSKVQKSYILSVFRKQRPDDIIEHFAIVIGENRKHKIKGIEDDEFGSVGHLLAYYETQRIHPGFPNIGQCYTESEFDAIQDELDTQEKQRTEQHHQLEAEHERLKEELEATREQLREVEKQKQEVEAAKRCVIL